MEIPSNINTPVICFNEYKVGNVNKIKQRVGFTLINVFNLPMKLNKYLHNMLYHQVLDLATIH